jgi:Glycosyltransferase like family 2
MSPASSCPPVLVLAFNRPDTTRRVLDSLRPVAPRHVYFAVDGPREGRAGEDHAVRQVQDLAAQMDWGCDVRTLFRDRNLGCKVAVSEALSWFFGAQESGIVLEDDCVAHPSFFRFASELLDRYRDDPRVAAIAGNNFQRGSPRTGYSYYFSRYCHVWGWASWRRAWLLYDHRMTLWPEVRAGGWLFDLLGDRHAARYWRRIFDATHADANSSWAYRWTFACWIHGALSVLPSANLVSNIGFGDGATHTVSTRSPFAAMPTSAMPFPLVHPPFMVRDARADRLTEKYLFSGPRGIGRVVRKMRRMLGLA